MDAFSSLFVLEGAAYSLACCFIYCLLYMPCVFPSFPLLLEMCTREEDEQEARFRNETAPCSSEVFIIQYQVIQRCCRVVLFTKTHLSDQSTASDYIPRLDHFSERTCKTTTSEEQVWREKKWVLRDLCVSARKSHQVSLRAKNQGTIKG